MIVTIRSNSSEVISPALVAGSVDAIAGRWLGIGLYRLLRSTSAFLQTKLEYLRPTPLILVRAYMIFCLPSTLVFRRRRMN